MATRLMFAAPSLLQKLTDTFWIPHPISFDASEKRWKLVTNRLKLLPFYFMTFFVIPVIGDGSIIVQSFKRFILKDLSVSKPVLCIFITLGFLSFFDWGFNIPLIIYGKQIVAYQNALLDFQLSLRPLKAKKKVTVKERKPVRKRDILKETIADIKFLVAALETDKFGIFLNLMVIYFHLLGFSLPIVGMIFNFDPILYLLRDLKLHEYLPWFAFLTLRYTICTICVQETVRTAALVIIGALTSYVVTNRLILILRNRPVSHNTLKMYLHLRIIHRSGDHMLKYLVSALLFTGFVLCVLFNCFTIVGWRVFPVSFYVACMPITFLVHFLIHVTIPLCAQSFETSASTIRYKWVSDLGVDREKNLSNFQRRMLLRMLKSMQSVAFHSSSVATVNYAMRLNYLEYILDKTADVLMVFQKQIDKMQKIKF